MTVLITLTDAGLDTGPFDLYSSSDAFTVPFETNVSKFSLTSGYISGFVPDFATTIRVVSIGTCSNFRDIVLSTTTTTTSSTTTITTTAFPVVSCNETTNPGGAGVTEYVIPLDPAGGFFAFEFNANSIADKAEILNNNVKKATTGMTVANSGPFDNIYGDPTVPTEPDTLTIDQFIGLNKGTIPNRQTEFDAEIGLGIIITSPYQQLIWWVYTAADYNISANAVLRVTGPVNTAWEIHRLCTAPTTTTTTTVAPTTTTTTTTVAPTTTTTTTAAPVVLEQATISSVSQATATNGCVLVVDSICYVNTSTNGQIATGDIVYNDAAGTNPIIGNNQYYKITLVNGYVVLINDLGEMFVDTICI
jgi:hypothetical protein